MCRLFSSNYDIDFFDVTETKQFIREKNFRTKSRKVAHQKLSEKRSYVMMVQSLSDVFYSRTSLRLAFGKWLDAIDMIGSQNVSYDRHIASASRSLRKQLTISLDSDSLKEMQDGSSIAENSDTTLDKIEGKDDLYTQ